MMQEVPDCCLFLRAHTGDAPAVCASNHSPRAAFADEVMTDGILLLPQLATRALQRDAAAGAHPSVV